MVTTIDIATLGAEQAPLYRLFRQDYPLPVNASAYPLAAGQIYGQVATNARLSDSKAAANKSLMSRSHHVARSPITEMAIVLPNWYWDISNTKFELPNGAGVQYTASVEYPAGTFRQFRFNGQVRGFCPDFHQLVTDFTSVSIAEGQSFWINIWCLNSGGTIVFQNAPQNATFGEKLNVHATLTADLTMSGHTGSTQTSGFWPTAIIGRTAAKSVLIVGDSIQRGIGDTNDGASALGLVPRAVAPFVAYINMGSSGDSIAVLLQTYAKRLQMTSYARNIVAAHGTNDIRNGRALSQVKLDLVAYWALLQSMLLPAGRLFQCTLTHATTSTDNWATVENQAAAPYFSTDGNGTRELLNDWLRDGAPLQAGAPAAVGSAFAVRAGSSGHPLHSVFDVADVLETARNSGRWKAEGTAAKWTADGVHPTQYGYIQAAQSGKIDVSQFV